MNLNLNPNQRPSGFKSGSHIFYGSTLAIMMLASPVLAGAARGPLASTGAVAVATDVAITLSLREALLTSLENNTALRVQRWTPAIQKTYEQQAAAVFDPAVTAQAQKDRAYNTQAPPFSATNQANLDNLSGGVGITEFLPTGTRIVLQGITEVDSSTLYSDRQASSQAGLSVAQSLLRGFGTSVNLASLRQARLDTQVTEYELRGYTETFVAQVETAYWSLALARRQLEIVKQSLALAERQRDEIAARIRVGKLSQVELKSAEAEVALRHEFLIDAQGTLEKRRLKIIQLVNPPGAGKWNLEVFLKDAPPVPREPLADVNTHVAVAMRMRPDINQARLSIQRGELEIIKTRNGLLPRLDAFVNLGKTGYGDSFGWATRDLNGDGNDLAVGLQFEYVLGNRDARAKHRRATYSLDQTREAMDNLKQLAEVEVRSAYVEVVRAREQVAATAAARQLQEDVMEAETGKLLVGKSTALLVAVAARDLLSSQITESLAIVTHLDAYIELYRLEGSLLERRGLDAPGREPLPGPN
ncbi:MAG: TolC family protein [bacterium]